MVITQTGLDVARETILDSFDSFGFIAVGDSTTTPLSSDTILGNEVFREAVYSVSKDLEPGVYVFTIYMTTVEGNFVLSEIGIFDTITGGNMGTKNLLPITYTKVLDEEVRIQIGVKVETSN